MGQPVSASIVRQQMKEAEDWKTIRRDDGKQKDQDGSKRGGLKQSPATIEWQA